MKSFNSSMDRVDELGEVFTPHELVREMLDMCPKDDWNNPSNIVGDITGCGNGNFLVEVIKRKIDAGLTPLQALNTTFGIDIMQDNVDECRERLLKQAEESSGQIRDDLWVRVVQHNIICGDGLTFDWDTFEVIKLPSIMIYEEHCKYAVCMNDECGTWLSDRVESLDEAKILANSVKSALRNPLSKSHRTIQYSVCGLKLIQRIEF